MDARPSSSPVRSQPALRQLGLVVHPTRPIDKALNAVDAWAATRGLTVGQVAVPGNKRHVADPVEAAACDLLLAIGGDGTALTALHAGAPTSRPVLAIACGSVGALTSLTVDRVAWALEQVAAGHWTPLKIPGLDVAWDGAEGETAINDVAVVRNGPGQILVSITVDSVEYAEVAGDGVVVATPLGSTAYNMAAGGPIFAPGAEGMAVTPLAPHGGSSPPLVTGNASQLALTIEAGYSGIRFELDGRREPVAGRLLRVRHRPDYAALVTLAGQEPRLTGLRRRRLVLDSPRALVRDARAYHEPAG